MNYRFLWFAEPNVISDARTAALLLLRLLLILFYYHDAI